MCKIKEISPRVSEVCSENEMRTDAITPRPNFMWDKKKHFSCELCLFYECHFLSVYIIFCYHGCSCSIHALHIRFELPHLQLKDDSNHKHEKHDKGPVIPAYTLIRRARRTSGFILNV